MGKNTSRTLNTRNVFHCFPETSSLSATTTMVESPLYDGRFHVVARQGSEAFSLHTHIFDWLSHPMAIMQYNDV